MDQKPKKISLIILLTIASFTLKAQEVMIGPAIANQGCQVCFDVTASNFNNVCAIQWTIDYNSNLLSLNEIISNISSNTGGSAGHHSFSAYNVQGISNGLLYTICFDILEIGNSSITFSNFITDIEIGTCNNQVLSGNFIGSNYTATTAQNIDINDNCISDINYEACIQISSAGQVCNNTNPSFTAGEAVNLLPGFSTSSNSCFEAKIDVSL